MKTSMAKLLKSSTELTITDLDNGLEFTLCQRPFTDVVMDQAGAVELIGTLWQRLAGRIGDGATRSLLDAWIPEQGLEAEVPLFDTGTAMATGLHEPAPVGFDTPAPMRPWEVVDETAEPDEVTLRLRVPGGWLYRVDVAGFSTLAFVPEAGGSDGVPTAEVQ